jgi:hypothetical protein
MARRYIIKNRPSEAERFWSKVEVCGPEECWPWKARRDTKGYGRYYTGSRSDGTRRSALAHRVAWVLANQASFLPGVCGCHHCDNPACCNPTHIFPGTRADNQADMCAKGRQVAPSGDRHPIRKNPGLVQGERNGNAKLREWQLPYILALVDAGVLQKDVAAAYGVAATAINRLVRGESWKSAAGGGWA